MARRPLREVAALVLLWLGGLASARAESYACVSFDYPPLVTAAPGRPPSGMAIELVQELFARLGHTMSVTLYPWGRSLATAKAGATDCIFTLFRSSERERFLDYTTESILEQDIVFYVRAGSSIRFDGALAPLRDLRIGTAHQINYGPRFESMRPFLEIDEAPSIEHNFLKLLAGRVDLVISNAGTAEALLALPSLRDQAHLLQRLPRSVESVPTHIAFPKTRKLHDLRDKIDAEIVRFRASQDYPQLLRRYQAARPIAIAQKPE